MVKKAQGEIDVILDANGAPVLKAIDNVVKRIKDIQKVVGDIEQASKRAADAWGKSQPKLANFDKHLKALEGFEKRLLNASRQPINQGNDDRLFANRVRKVHEFQQKLRDATTTAEAFAARLAALDRKLVTVGNSGKIDGKAMTKRLGLEDAEKRFKNLQREIERTDAMASKAGVRPSRSGVVGAENNLFSALLNPRRDVGKAIEQLRIASAQYQAAVREEMRKIQAASGGGAPPKGGGGGGGNGLFGKSGITGVFARTAAYGGAAAAIYSTIAAIKDGLTFSIRFEDSIQKIGAVAGLTNTQMAGLSETIFSVGRNSRFATEDIAEATMVLAQAGFSAQDIEKTLMSVANLASAAGVTFAEATDVITSAIGSFQLQASEAARITDVLTAALNNTKLNIQQVALGIQYAGATAYEMKISFEELTAVMATMAQAGIRSGSTIGTGLRQFLVDLQTPTTKFAEKLKSLGLTMDDINVKTLGLPEVLNRLAAAGFDASAAYGTLETRAAAAYLVLKNNRDVIDKMTIAQNQVGVAAEAAAKGQDSLAAQWQRFKNILNETVSGGIEPAQNAVQKLLENYNALASDKYLLELMKQRDNTEELSAEWMKLTATIDEYKEAVKQNLEIERVSRAELERTTTALNIARDAYETQQQTIESISDAIFKVMLRNQQLKTGSIALSAETASLTARFAGLASELYGTASSYDNLVLAMQRYRNQAIAIGAMKAQEQAFAAGNQAQAQNNRAARLGGAFKRSGGLEKLPANVRSAFNALVDNPSNLMAQRVVYDYANSADAKNTFNAPQLDQLRGYATARGRQAGAAQTYRDSVLQRDIYGQLGTTQGKLELNKLDNLARGASNDDIKAQLQIWADQANDPKKSASVRGAMNTLIQQGQGLLGVAAAPAPPDKKEKKGNDRREDKAQLAIMRERLKATQAALDNAIKNIASETGGASALDGEDIVVTANRGLTKSRLLKNIRQADAALDKWVEHRFDLMNAEIDEKNMTGEEAQLFKAEVQREIDEKREATNRSIVDGIGGALQAMVDVITLAAEDAQKAVEQAYAMSQARLAALDRSSMRGRVPDFVRNHYARRDADASDNKDRATIAVNDAHIADLQNKINLGRELLSSDEMATKGQDLQKLRLEVEDFERQLLDLSNTNDVLKASFEGDSLLPQNFADALSMAVEDFREINGLNQSILETLQGEMPDALSAVSEGFSTFFMDIMTGTKTVKAAFADFVKSMIKYIMQLVAKIVAMKVIQLLLSFIPGGGGAAAGGSGLSGIGPGVIGPAYHGGPVKGAYRGEYIKDGNPGRDSTLRKLAKGEYVVRKAAVDSVGADFMHRLNQQGKASLPGGFMPPAQDVRQNMAIYVVKEGEKPQMGPNDVLLAVHDDILKDGQTKRLIKLVSQGA